MNNPPRPVAIVPSRLSGTASGAALGMPLRRVDSPAGLPQHRWVCAVDPNDSDQGRTLPLQPRRDLPNNNRCGQWSCHKDGTTDQLPWRGFQPQDLGMAQPNQWSPQQTINQATTSCDTLSQGLALFQTRQQTNHIWSRLLLTVEPTMPPPSALGPPLCPCPGPFPRCPVIESPQSQGGPSEPRFGMAGRSRLAVKQGRTQGGLKKVEKRAALV